MHKKITTRAISLLLLVAMLLSLSACRTVSGNGYTKKTELQGLGNSSELIASAQTKTDALESIGYTYAFFIELNAPNGDHFKLGTENNFLFSGRGTENPSGYRKNVYTSTEPDTVNVVTKDEEFFLNSGNIYTERFGKRYKCSMNEKEFLDYTEYSDMSVNLFYLDERNFSDATVYKLFGGRTEITFDGASDALNEAIIAFTGLNDTKYAYDVTDTALSVLIDKNGMLTEKHLTFNVTYYAVSAPNSTLTYVGDFAYTVDKTEGVAVPERNKSLSYQDMPHLKLFSSITGAGFDKLLSQNGLDVLYSKYIKVSEQSTKEYIFDAKAHITASYLGAQLCYGSVDTEYSSTEKKAHNTTGIFQTPSGYSYRFYDHIEGKRNPDIDQPEAKYDESQLLSLISSTIRSEQLFEEEISSVSVKAEDEASVTFAIRFNNQAARVYASYLVDAFSTSTSSTADLNGQALTLNKCDIEVRVRKSDGCLLSEKIDFNAEIIGTGAISGYLTVEGAFVLSVLATENVTVITPSAFDEELTKLQ